MPFQFNKPAVVTEADLKAPWFGYRNGARFRCSMCGYRFGVGDYYRIIMATGKGMPNPLVCASCEFGNNIVAEADYEAFLADTDILERWKAQIEEARTRFTYFTTCFFEGCQNNE